MGSEAKYPKTGCELYEDCLTCPDKLAFSDKCPMQRVCITKQGRRKLQHEEIRKKFKASGSKQTTGATIKQLAEEYNLHIRTIYRICEKVKDAPKSRRI